MKIDKLKSMLHLAECSCVIYNGSIRTFHKRGVRDIFCLLKSEPQFLRGALIADKVIGRAAAAILIVGEVTEIYTKVISRTALEILKGTNIKLSYDKVIDYIPNRTRTDLCPMERACSGVQDAQEAVEILTKWHFPDGTTLMD